MDTDSVFDWITKNVESAVVEEVTDEILEELIKDHEYVGVFFRGPCDEETDDCDAVLAKLESIDDELDDIGILLVSTADKEVSRNNGKSPSWISQLFYFSRKIFRFERVASSGDVQEWFDGQFYRGRPGGHRETAQ